MESLPPLPNIETNYFYIFPPSELTQVHCEDCSHPRMAVEETRDVVVRASEEIGKAGDSTVNGQTDRGSWMNCGHLR